MSNAHQEMAALVIVAGVAAGLGWRLWARPALGWLAMRELRRGHVKRAMRLRKWSGWAGSEDCC